MLTDAFCVLQSLRNYCIKNIRENIQVSAALKDSLEHRLKRAGYVESIDIPAKKGKIKPVKKSLYSITPKGKRLLEGWILFLKAYG
jgi:DNA-binding PadR family transcriptional regulator